MVTVDELRRLALALPETKEEPHFEKISFRVNKKIFATYDLNTSRACLKLSVIDQDVFSSCDKANIYPVNNSWGTKGWTFVDMNFVNNELFEDALKTAYCEVASPNISILVRPTYIPSLF